MISHREIEDLGLVERYVRDDLTAQEAERFEAHLVTCGECAREVEWAEDLRQTLRQTLRQGGELEAVREISHEAETAPARIHHAVSPGWRTAALALAAALLVALVVVPRALVRAPGSEDGSPASAEMVGRLQALEDELAALRQPRVHSRVHFLGVSRGDTVAAVPLPNDGITLVADVGVDPGPGRYRVRLETAEGRLVWSSDEAESDGAGLFTFTFPPGALTLGTYRLTLAHTHQESEELLAVFDLQLVPAAGR